MEPGLPLPPLSLYVHWPWCVRKCPYCDFNSHEARGTLPEHDYVAALLRDAELAVPAVQGRAVESVFIGGGTPSLMSPAALATLLTGLRRVLPVAADAEITLEANPGTVEAGKFREFRSAGINRLSVGVQSFHGSQLARLGRIHDAAEAHRAVAIALTSFGNVNLDLMYVLPEQTVAEALADAREAAQSGAAHLSFYHLTIEPNTVFAARPPRLPDPDAAAAIEDAVHDCLAGAGFGRYEVSAWARPGRECRHNLNYWLSGDYIGIGAGAHGRTTWPTRITRESRTRAPADYLRRIAAGDARAEHHDVQPADAVFEFFMNGLRLTGGAPVAAFASRTGQDAAVAAPAIAAATARGLLTCEDGHWRATPLGQRFLNDLLELFLPQ